MSTKASLEQIITLLQMAIAKKWPDDGIRPGLVLSYLSDGTFYASICRYRYAGPRVDKCVVYKATSGTAKGAVLDLAIKLVDLNDPLEKLREALG